MGREKRVEKRKIGQNITEAQMDKHTALITKFYTAFQQKDYRAMAASYHPEAHFEDAAFQLSSGEDIGAMWKFLVTNGRDLQVEFGHVRAEGTAGGSAHWEARYTFSATGRKVHNVVEASFEFKDGLIYRHTDRFSFWRWSRQALGLTGWLLGWSGFLQKKVSQTAMKRLQKFIEKEAGQ
jgi:ketosteroid isomerase-like protein